MPYTPKSTRNIGEFNRGRRRNTITDPAPQAAKKTKSPQKQNQTPPPAPKYIIKNTVTKVKLFPSPKKNRRMTPEEFEQELIDAKAWGRVPRSYIFDHPTYAWVPEVPKYTVNFDLNAPQ